MKADTVDSTTAAASALIYTGKGAFYGATLTAGADTATLIVYDNTSATGTVLCKLSAVANTSAAWAPGFRRPVYIGIYAALTGTTPSATVAWS